MERRAARLFVALPVPAEVAARLAAVRPEIDGLRIVPTENFHLTLRFLGQVPQADIPPLAKALASLRADSVAVTVQGAGYFPPAIVWAGVVPSAPLLALHSLVAKALEPLGYSPERRPFAPHITLARGARVEPEALKTFLTFRKDFRLPPFTADRFALYASPAQGGGARYEIVREFPLA